MLVEGLDVRMFSARDFLGPTVGDSVIFPRACADRRLLQNEHIIAAPAGPLAHSEGDAEMVGFAQTVCVDPAHEISAGRPR